MASRPLKILHVVFTLEPGGMENGIVNMARALDPARFDIHVCCLERPGAFAERLPSPHQVTALGKTPGFSLAAGGALRREILKLRPGLIHSHNLGPLIYSALATAAGSTVPILQGEHAELTREELTPRRLRQRRWLYRCCKAVHSVSQGLHAQLSHLGFPPSKLRLTLNGVDTARFAPGERTVARRSLGVPDSARLLGIVGRFGPFKQHRVLIESFENLADRHSDLHLAIVGGGGPNEQAVRTQQRESRHSGRIWLAGFQSDPRPWYHALDLLVVPSINEGLSNAVLEAMACGIPVLAHEACGNAEVVSPGQDGFLADLATRESLQAALAGVLEQAGGLPAMGLRARQTVAARFSLEKMRHAYESLYLELGKH